MVHFPVHLTRFRDLKRCVLFVFVCELCLVVLYVHSYACAEVWANVAMLAMRKCLRRKLNVTTLECCRDSL